MPDVFREHQFIMLENFETIYLFTNRTVPCMSQSFLAGSASDSEIRNIQVPDRFRNPQTVLFSEKRKKIGPKINLFSVKYLN